MSSTKTVRVLVADDEEHVRQLMKGVLGAMRWDVVGEATNGEEAVANFKELRPDAILLDINMPVMAGIEALQAIRAESRDVVIVMLTSMIDMDTVDACIAAGASHYLRKDTPLAEMRQALVKTWCRFGPADGDAS